MLHLLAVFLEARHPLSPVAYVNTPGRLILGDAPCSMGCFYSAFGVPRPALHPKLHSFIVTGLCPCLIIPHTPQRLRLAGSKALVWNL